MYTEKKKIYLETREKLKALNHAFVVISWDSETEAPVQALDKRSEVIGTLSGMYNDLLFDDEYVEAVNYLYNNPNKEDPLFTREIEVVKKGLDNTLKLPKELLIESSVVTAKAGPAWVEAKTKDDYSIFMPYLEKIVDIQRKTIKYLETDELKGYDVLLDQYEEGMTKEKYKVSKRRIRSRRNKSSYYYAKSYRR